MAAIRAITPIISSRVRCSPSGLPSDHDTPALVVAIARAPAAAIMAALPASQAFGTTKIPSACRERKASVFACWRLSAIGFPFLFCCFRLPGCSGARAMRDGMAHCPFRQ